MSSVHASSIERAGAAPVGDASLAAGYGAARAVVRVRARNFYWGLRLTPWPRRDGIYAVYAWMRAGDDASDAPLPASERRASLQKFAAQTAQALDGHTDALTREPGGAWWPAFADASRRYSLGDDVVAPMLLGLAEDLEHSGYADMAGLEGYCRRVAGTAGRACVRVWGVRSGVDLAGAMAMADELGIAFQLTNIVRDLGQDGRDGRCYVPRELLLACGVTEAELAGWSRPEACALVVGALVERARVKYAAAKAVQGLIAPDCAPTLAAMVGIYRRVLEACAASPCRCVLGPRVRLSGLVKARVMLGALLAPRDDSRGDS